MRRIIVIGVLLIFLLPQKVFAASFFTQNPDKTNIGINDEISVSTNLSINVSDGTQYYLKGVFYKPGTSNYCGYIWNGSGWYSDGWANFLPITVQNASWSGMLKIKVDPSDSGCKESGNYLFKVQRFTSSGNSSIASDDQNDIQFVITVPTATPITVPTATPTKVPTPTSTPIKTPTPIKSEPIPTSANSSPSFGLSPTRTFAPAIKNKSNAGEVLGTSTNKNNESPTPEALIKGESGSIFQSWTFFVLSGIGIITIGCGILLFREWKKQKSLEL